MAVKILKFCATWCNACNQADKYLDRTSGDRELEVQKIDVDASEELAVKYNIRSIPTFVAVKPNGDIVGTIVGFDSKKLEEFFENVKYK